jgi:hypothetical protein
VSEAVAIATMIVTLVLAGATVALAFVARAELGELRAQRHASEEARERDARRARAMSLFSVLVRCYDALKAFETDVATGEHGLQHGLVGSMYDAGAAKWGRFSGDWESARPELTTWLYVCDFVSDDLRQSIRQRFEAVETTVSARDERRTLEAVKNLEASLDQVRELIDRELGLKASRRPL